LPSTGPPDRENVRYSTSSSGRKSSNKRKGCIRRVRRAFLDPQDFAVLQENIRFAKELGAKVVKLKGRRVADALIEFARKEGITHVVFGQSARSRWDIFLHGSVINRFLSDVRDASVHVVPLEPKKANGGSRNDGQRIM